MRLYLCVVAALRGLTEMVGWGKEGGQFYSNAYGAHLFFKSQYDIFFCFCGL